MRRNRAKRLMREVFRHCKGQGGLDIVALLRPGFDDIAYTEIDADYRATLERITRRT